MEVFLSLILDCMLKPFLSALYQFGLILKLLCLGEQLRNQFYPYKLKHLVFSGVPLRQCKSRFGPIVTHLLSTWRDVERCSQLVTIWHRHLPIFHNINLLSGSTPFHCLQWTHNKVNTLGDIYDDSGFKILPESQNSI